MDGQIKDSYKKSWKESTLADDVSISPKNLKEVSTCK